MKYFKSRIFQLLIAGAVLASCEKEEDRVTFTGGTPPVLTVSSETDLVLTKAMENYSSLQFQWTNPEYGFSNGVNTQDVSYTLEIDTAGANFTNPKQVALGFTRDLSTSFSVKELNSILSILELKDFMEHTFEFRIKSSLANGSVPLYSNVIPINITTYLDVVYPVPDKLFITGAATPAGWMGDGNPDNAAQELIKVNTYLFELASLNINGNSGFLFVPDYGNWSNKYGFTGAKEANNTTGDFFKPNGEDFRSPAEGGNYKITVNFKTGKYSFEKL